jgi:hypothetical protein
MKEIARVSPERVWKAWVKAHAVELVSGSKGYREQGKRKIPYQIIDVVPGKSFSILWKSMFVRFVFLHEVIPSLRGSEIRYDFQVTGPLAWMVRWMLVPKIRSNLSFVLKEFVKQLEAH